MAILHLLRHAKSDSEHYFGDDHERPLAPRGQRAALVMGEFMTQTAVSPDLILCSSAVRTRETLERILTCLEDGTEVRVERDLYLASAAAMLELAQTVGDGIEELMIIAHNPGTAYLAAHLCGSGPAEQLQRIRTKYPTAGLCSIRFDAPFSQIVAGAGELQRFVTPKNLV